MLALLALAAHAGGLTVTSATFQPGAAIPQTSVYSGYGCTGGNRSPQLAWTGAPAGTRSFAILGHDPDAPRAGGWTHWLVVDLPASTTSLPEDAGRPDNTGLPTGAVQPLTDFGGPGYGGPCPPPGAPHHYVFTVYALDVASLPVAKDAGKKGLEAALQGHVLASGAITGTWGR